MRMGPHVTLRWWCGKAAPVRRTLWTTWIPKRAQALAGEGSAAVGIRSKLDPDNRWIRLAAIVPWDQLALVLAASLTALDLRVGGRPTLDPRLALAALLVQRIENLCDERIVILLTENVYVQYFRGWAGFDAKPQTYRREAARCFASFAERRRQALSGSAPAAANSSSTSNAARSGRAPRVQTPTTRASAREPRVSSSPRAAGTTRRASWPTAPACGIGACARTSRPGGSSKRTRRWGSRRRIPMRSRRARRRRGHRGSATR